MINPDMMSNSCLNKSSSARHNSRCSFHLNETIEEEESVTETENVPHLKRNTPILFSTNRGLHLRTSTLNAVMTSADKFLASCNASRITTKDSPNYNLCFCDLERWSTNRANGISLEDTFTIPKPGVVPSSAASGSLASNSLRFLPQKSNSVRFHGYTRFDIE